MKFRSYIKDKYVYLIASITTTILSLLFFNILNIGTQGIIVLQVLIVSGFVIPLVTEYFQKNKYYKKMNSIIENLDQKTLLCEMIDGGNFIESQFFYEVLKQATKSMNDEIGHYRKESSEYMEYINLWIHEIKTPIAAAKLVSLNNSSEYSKSIVEELEKIEDYAQQVMFYSKSFSVATDYNLSKILLEDLVNIAVINNAKVLIRLKINILKTDLSQYIVTDKKWLVFMMSQIIMNSVAYMDKTEKQVHFKAYEEDGLMVLSIKDNGMGIDHKDIGRIFDKGFVGENGRKKSQSTGFGLYICKRLCESLNIGISAYSEKDKFTEILLRFPKIVD